MNPLLPYMENRRELIRAVRLLLKTIDEKSLHAMFIPEHLSYALQSANTLPDGMEARLPAACGIRNLKLDNGDPDCIEVSA